MRTIPEIRDRLIEIADHFTDMVRRSPNLSSLAPVGEEIRQLALETRRRPCVRRARAKLTKLTPALKAEIEQAADLFPKHSYQELAELVGTNTGRVSEALAGKRGG